MKTWATLCVALCLLTGPALAQDAAGNGEAPVSEGAANTPSDTGPEDQAKSEETPDAGAAREAEKTENSGKKEEKKASGKKNGSAKTEGGAKKDAATGGNGESATKKKASAKKNGGTAAGHGAQEPKSEKRQAKKAPADDAQTGGGAPNKNANARSGTSVYKEGGKTCSGLDEFKVCW